MIWSRLKNNKCPKCNNLLMECGNGKQVGYGCSTKGYKCTFFIGKERFNEVIKSLYSCQKSINYEDNLSELNNL